MQNKTSAYASRTSYAQHIYIIRSSMLEIYSMSISKQLLLTNNSFTERFMQGEINYAHYETNYVQSIGYYKNDAEVIS